MKLVLLSSNYPPRFEGGTERVVRAQARELAALGHEVSIVAGTDDLHEGADVERAEVDGLSVAFLPRLETEYYDIHYTRPRIVELVRRECAGADWVHAHHWFPFGCELLRPLAAEHRLALTLHDLFATCPRFFRATPVPGLACPERGDFEPCLECVASELPAPRARDELRASFELRAAAFDAEVRSAELLLAPSRAHASRAAELLGLDRARVRVLPHGLCEPIERTERAPTWTGDRPLRVLHPGHRTPSKGTLDLVRALAALPAGSVELVLAGSEVEPGFDEQLDGAAGELTLERLPEYDRTELPELFAAADLVALPSRAAESFGLVLDEALACGLPTWVSDRGALAERVGGAGRVLPAEDPSAWTRAFEELLRAPEILARELAALPETLPTARETALRLDELYREVPSGSTRTPRD